MVIDPLNHFCLFLKEKSWIFQEQGEKVEKKAGETTPTLVANLHFS